MRIQLNGTLKLLDAFSQRFSAASLPVVSALQVELVRFEIVRRFYGLRDRTLVFSAECDLESSYDTVRYFFLNSKDILQFAVVAVGPKMAIGFYIDELRCDTNLVTGLANAAFKNVVDFKLVGNLRNAQLRFLESKGRRA